MIRNVIAGAAAGAIGTLAMDMVWYRRYRNSAGRQSFARWETAEGTATYEDAAAPAQVAKIVAERIGVSLPDSSARLVTNAVHWATGIGWGKAHGLASTVLGTSSPQLGLVTGIVAWGTSYATLGPLGVYEPIWKYSVETLWKDLSAHLVYGASLGVAYRLLAGPA